MLYLYVGAIKIREEMECGLTQTLIYDNLWVKNLGRAFNRSKIRDISMLQLDFRSNG